MRSKQIVLTCVGCNKTFEVPWEYRFRKYCSRVCWRDSPNKTRGVHGKKDRVILACLNCGREFETIRSFSYKRKFCSFVCSNQYNQKDGSWNKGIPHTEEAKLHISLGGKRARAKGNYINPSTRPEVRAKISKTITELFKNPKNNPRYIDGRSKEPYSLGFNRRFKEQIRERDGYRCQKCGVPQSECVRALDVHHIDRDKKSLDPKDFITLCRICHLQEHTNENDRRESKLQLCVSAVHVQR